MSCSILSYGRAAEIVVEVLHPRARRLDKIHQTCIELLSSNAQAVRRLRQLQVGRKSVMAHTNDHERVLDVVNPSKREFLRRLIIGTAFAVPLVSSVAVADLSANMVGSGFKTTSCPVGYDCTPV
jgi:hypothetical protein